MRRSTSWRCPVCHASRYTTPLHEAFCTDDYAAMEPEHVDLTDMLLTYPHLTPEQGRIDRLMREMPARS